MFFSLLGHVENRSRVRAGDRIFDGHPRAMESSSDRARLIDVVDVVALASGHRTEIGGELTTLTRVLAELRGQVGLGQFLGRGSETVLSSFKGFDQILGYLLVPRHQRFLRIEIKSFTPRPLAANTVLYETSCASSVRLSGFAMAPGLATFSIGWPCRIFLTGSSIFFPETVRGIDPTK